MIALLLCIFGVFFTGVIVGVAIAVDPAHGRSARKNQPPRSRP